MRHKHADLIHAWAEGAEIEMYYGKQGWRHMPNPSFIETLEYRIKPEKKPDVVYRGVLRAGDCVIESILAGEANIICTFSGDTGKLIKAEVL